MKNVLFAFFMLVVCVAGTVIATAAYFGLIFSVLASLAGAYPNDIGQNDIGQYVGPMTAAIGPPLGAMVFFVLFWDRLVLADGQPDRIARRLALGLGMAVALAGLVAVGPALAVVEAFKVPVVLAVAGFATLVGWVHRNFRRA